ncbi:hypothetical protein CRYUN_Cryun18bG0112700 [Craigia yunnanensis]
MSMEVPNLCMNFNKGCHLPSRRAATSTTIFKKVAEDLNRQAGTEVKKCKTEWNGQDIGLNMVNFDETRMPVPVCSCTGVPRQCYKWGNGGWQSSCCTTTMSSYPLPQMPNKRHARVGGRKMSGSVFTKLLSRLAAEEQDLSIPLDLKNYWARHGTNRYITINQYHPGFHWIVYSASAITSLPILIWIIFLLFAICFHTSPSSNLPKSHQTQTHQLTDTEAAAAAQDELAMVQTEILNNHPSGLTEEQPVCKILIPVSQPRNSIEDNKQALKRTLSLPLFHVPTDYSNFKRSMSLKQ